MAVCGWLSAVVGRESVFYRQVGREAVSVSEKQERGLMRDGDTRIVDMVRL